MFSMIYGAFKLLLTRNGPQRVRSIYDVRSGGVSIRGSLLAARGCPIKGLGCEQRSTKQQGEASREQR
jgi:hypothetical protein